MKHCERCGLGEVEYAACEEPKEQAEGKGA